MASRSTCGASAGARRLTERYLEGPRSSMDGNVKACAPEKLSLVDFLNFDIGEFIYIKLKIYIVKIKI